MEELYIDGGAQIDRAATEGLEGIPDSAAYRIHEVERHLHSMGRWFGQDPGDTFLLEDGLTPWRVTAGSSQAWGAWLQVSDGDEITDVVKFDPHLVHVTAASANGALYYIQLGYGESGAQVVFAMASFQPAAALKQGAEPMQARRVGVTEKLWARCKSATNGATIDFTLGGHGYEG